jgi:hypothetical protein
MSSGRRARLQRLRERALKARRNDAIEIRLAPWLQEIVDQAARREDAPRRQCPNETCGAPVTYRAERCPTCGAALTWADTESDQ